MSDAPAVVQCIPSMAGGGAERQFIYLTRGLVSRGWRVTAVVTHAGPHYEELKQSGARIVRPAAVTNYDPRLFFEVRRIIRDERPSLVQTWLLQMDVFGGLAALCSAVPWILSERSHEACYQRSLKYRLRETLARHASAIIANSCGGDAYWRTRVGVGTVRRVIPNGVPLEAIEAATPFASSEIGIPDDAHVVLLAGRRSPEKNWGALVLALDSVLRRRPAVLVFCGAGLDSGGLPRKLADEHGVHRVRVLGHVSDIWRWMKRADVFVSVGLFEGRPNTVLEAMASGCPLVVSDIPSHREFLDESTSVFVDPRRSAAIALGIETCLVDPQSAKDRSARARGAVAQWSVGRMVTAYEELYHDLIRADRGLRGAGS